MDITSSLAASLQGYLDTIRTIDGASQGASSSALSGIGGADFADVLSEVSGSGSLTGVTGTDSLTASAQSLNPYPDGTSLFTDVALRLVDGVNSTDATFQADLVKAAAGELDNPHQLLIDSEKANVSLQLMISMRNKALEAYNSIISMQV